MLPEYVRSGYDKDGYFVYAKETKELKKDREARIKQHQRQIRHYFPKYQFREK